MKASFISKSLVLVSLLVFPLLNCLGQNDPAGQVVGTWIKVQDTNTINLTMKADQKLEVEFTGDDIIDVYGSYKISGSRITFQDEGGEYSSGTSGVYEFKLGDNSISFTKVDDPVDGRSMLIQGTWARAEAN